MALNKPISDNSPLLSEGFFAASRHGDIPARGFTVSGSGDVIPRTPRENGAYFLHAMLAAARGP